MIAPLCKFIEALLELFLPVMMATALDLVDSSAGTRRELLSRCLMMALVTAGGSCFALVCQYLTVVCTQAYGTALRDALFRKAAGMDSTSAARFGVGGLTSRLTSDTVKLQTGISLFIRLAVRAPFLCVGAAIMAIIINPRMSPLVIILLVIFSFILWLVMFKSLPVSVKAGERLDHLARLLRENLSGMRVIRAFLRVGSRKEQFAAAADSHRVQMEKANLIGSSLSPVTSLLMNAAIALLVWLGAGQVSEGSMTKGEIVAFISYISQIMMQMILTSWLTIRLSDAMAGAKRIAEVFDARADVVDPVEAKLFSSGSNHEYAVRFDQVSFTYPGQSEPAVSDISFALPKGSRLGIIGATGSGKTTLARLLTREFDVSEGAVLALGRDVRDVPLRGLMENIALVPQKSTLHSGTIAENIRKGKNDASDDELREALRDAQALGFVRERSGGLNSRVERGGVNLSGGQRQRLCVARALAKKAPILVLDDCSSSLDAATEADMLCAIEKSRAGAAVIIISQRISAVRSCENLIMMDGGEIAGQGTHASLLETCGEYRELCLSQEVVPGTK